MVRITRFGLAAAIAVLIAGPALAGDPPPADNPVGHNYLRSTQSGGYNTYSGTSVGNNTVINEQVGNNNTATQYVEGNGNVQTNKQIGSDGVSEQVIVGSNNRQTSGQYGRYNESHQLIVGSTNTQKNKQASSGRGKNLSYQMSIGNRRSTQSNTQIIR